MNTTDKEKSAVGAATPATENRKEISKVSITDSAEKIKMQKSPFGYYYHHPICRFLRQYEEKQNGKHD